MLYLKTQRYYTILDESAQTFYVYCVFTKFKHNIHRCYTAQFLDRVLKVYIAFHVRVIVDVQVSLDETFSDFSF